MPIRPKRSVSFSGQDVLIELPDDHKEEVALYSWRTEWRKKRSRKARGLDSDILSDGLPQTESPQDGTGTCNVETKIAKCDMGLEGVHESSSEDVNP